MWQGLARAQQFSCCSISLSVCLSAGLFASCTLLSVCRCSFLFVSLPYKTLSLAASLLLSFCISLSLSLDISLIHTALSRSLATSFSQCISVSLSHAQVSTHTHPKHARAHTHTHTRSHTYTHHRTGKREAEKNKRRKGWQGGAICLEARTEAIVGEESNEVCDAQ